MAQVHVRDENESLIVENAVIAMTLAKGQKGAVISIINKPSSSEFCVKDSPAPLFQISVLPRSEPTQKPTWLSAKDAESVDYKTDNAGAILTFRRVGGRDVTVVCRVRLDAAGLSLWDIRVESAESLILEDVEYPVLALAAPLGDNGDDDVFVYGLSKGGEFHQPHRWPAGKWVSARQPGVLASQFGCYYDSRAGLYSATQDSKGYPKTFGMRRAKTGVEMFWRHHGFHDLAAPFELPYPVAQTTFRSSEADMPTNWRDAADIYKAWTLQQRWCSQTLIRRSDLPSWIRQGPMMVRFGRDWLGKPERIKGWLNDYYHKYFPGVPLIVAFWGWEGIGSWVSPEYFPPYPSEDGLRTCVDLSHGVGGHTFFWPSGYQWALTYNKREDGTFEHDGRESYEKSGRAHTIIGRDGLHYIREYPWLRGGQNATLCRGDVWTRDWLNNIAMELTKRGADMIQIDQVVGAGMPGGGNCYSRDHGHPAGPGRWDADAFHAQLLTMRERCKANNPKIVLGFEEPQELFNHYIGIQDYRDWEVVGKPQVQGHVPASIFGYLYHEFVPCFQSNPHAGDKVMMAYCMVNGQIPHVVPHWPLQPAPMLGNGGFEEWNENVPDRWDHVKGWKERKYEGVPACDGAIKHGGQFSLRLECAKDDDVTQVSQNVPIGENGLKPGSRYRLSLWYKAELLPKSNSIPFAALDRQLKSKGGGQIPIAQGSDWQRGEAEFTVPEGADFLRIMLNIVGPCKIWLDDTALDEAAGDGQWRPVMTKGIPPDHDLAVQWVNLFHGEGRPYLLWGRMLHPPKLTCGEIEVRPDCRLPAILHNAFSAPDGSEAVIAVNITNEVQQGTLAWAAKTIDLSLKPWEARLIKK
ncbi:MAG: DUF6259 domain-containing protein [Planctomycetota bacterium]